MERQEQVRQLEARAAAAATLGEAQALQAEADRLRGVQRSAGIGAWTAQPLFRN